MEIEIRNLAGRPWWLTDPLQATVYDPAGDERHASDLYVDLEPRGYHVFELS
jgi:hypothetical protein